MISEFGFGAMVAPGAKRRAMDRFPSRTRPFARHHHGP